jgi:hypothetical protein
MKIFSIYKSIITTIVCLTLAGCSYYASPVKRNVVSTNYETVYNPNINSQSIVNLGDTMMMQGRGWYVDCVIPKFRYSESSKSVFLLTVKKGIKMCGKWEEDNFFSSSYDPFGESIVFPQRAYWSVTEIGNNMAEWCAGGTTTYCHTRSTNDYEIIREFKQSRDTFQQSIEYMGRSGDVLKFIYVEFNENMARAAFNRNFQVDLKEGKIVNYKGAEIEIIEADNVQVTYVIKKYFGGAR